MGIVRLGIYLSVLALSPLAFGQNGTGVTTRISMTTAGMQGGSGTRDIGISGDGGFAVFESLDDLVPGALGWSNVYGYDVTLGTLQLITLNRFGLPSNNGGSEPTISTNGRWVAFTSTSQDLTVEDGDDGPDVFARDLVLGHTYLLHKNSLGQKGLGHATGCRLSADGRYAVFTSDASNLAAGDGNFVKDAFLRDTHTGITERVSVSSGGAEGNGESVALAVSNDGSLVLMYSVASNLVPGDTNGVADIFLRNRASGTTTRLSVRGDGTQSTGTIWDAQMSDDGAFVSITTRDALLSTDVNSSDDVYVREVATNELTLVSKSPITGLSVDGSSRGLDINPDGSLVCFRTSADTLLAQNQNAHHENLVVWSKPQGTLSIALTSTAGVQPFRGNWNQFPATFRDAEISSDGSSVLAGCNAINLVCNDTNDDTDVFLYRRDALRDVLVPSTLNVVRGRLVSGTTTSVADDDGSFVNIAPGPTFTTNEPQIVVDFTATTTVMAPRRIEVQIDSDYYQRPLNVFQELFLYNFVQQRFDLLHETQMWLSPTWVIGGKESTAADYVGPGGIVSVRLTMRRTNVVPTGNRWGALVDMLRIAVIP